MEQLTFKQIRQLKGIKSGFVSVKLGISRQALFNKESGKTKFTALEAQKLCDLYGVSIADVKL